MVNWKSIIEVIGILLIIIASIMLIPMIADIITHHSDWKSFALSAFITVFFGGSFYLSNQGYKRYITTKEAFILTSTVWVVLPLFAALPFLFSSTELSFTDAFFEAVSGLTSCGATVITGLDHLPSGILLWRALLNWIGGIGIIVIALAVLPMLRIAGMQLFKMESSEKSEKIFPRATQLAGATVGIYVFMTASCAIALWWADMSSFDAVAHAMSAMATGGFTTHDSSIGFFNSATIEFIICITMILSCFPFVLYIQLVQGNIKPLWNDSQIKAFLTLLAGAVLSTALWLTYHQGMPFAGSLRTALFNITSVMTTSGFSSENYAKWGSYGVFMIFLVSFIGGCTGSTTGAIKIFRIQIIFQLLKSQLRQLIHPHGVFRVQFNGKTVSDTVITSVLVFLFVYIFFFFLFTLLLSANGVDFITSMSAVSAAIAAAGYGLGDIINPSGSYAPLPIFSKWVLCIAMIIGRLEFFTVLVLFSPAFWRK